MRFDKAVLVSIQRFLDEKWPRPRTCPVCRTNPVHWRVSDTPVLLPLLTGNAEVSVHNFERAAQSLAVAPAVALTCSNCGHILFFSATEMGIGSVEERIEARFTVPSE